MNNNDLRMEIEKIFISHSYAQLECVDELLALVDREKGEVFEKGFRDAIDAFELWLLEEQVIIPNIDRLIAVLNTKLGLHKLSLKENKLTKPSVKMEGGS